MESGSGGLRCGVWYDIGVLIMRGNDVKNELSPEEAEVVMALEYNLRPFTIKTLAKAVYSTEEQVREMLDNLGLLDLVSKERVAERRKIRSLAQQARMDLARATQDNRQ
jgi:DNA-binding MarR family transcriptional regulator